MSDTNRLSATRAGKKCGDFAETTALRENKLKSHNDWTGLPRPGLARSAHRGRIKFLKGYVSKSSAVLNRLTITQLGSY